MSFTDLRSFLDRLRGDGDLVTVDAEVDAHLEIAEIHRRVIAAGGPAILFTNVRLGSPKSSRGQSRSTFPVATNLFGTARRAELAFGERPLRLVRRAVELVERLMPPTASTLWGARDVGFELMKVGTRRVSRGPVVDQITSEPALTRLPALTCWPEDGGPFITLPLVYTTHPVRGGHNLGIYRMQVYDGRRAGMHWQIGKGGGFHYAAAEALSQSLPVTVFLGGPPALLLSAVAPLPENVPELLLASLIAGERLPQVHGHGAHPLVATAEFALMGEVPPGVRHPEG
ncbi:MAG: 4-hydroxybenzoate decarboxylase, partial [Acidimicrobiia bacterium]|nr:4-hydroxybenzoate decarboxylase [Acidimicrobiia bacterium]